jgi:futalosine hydrolase
VRQYELVINAGIAGTLDASIPVGTGTVVSTDRFELTLEDGTPLRLPDGHRTVERARSDAALVQRMQREGFAPVTGVTVGRVTSTDETALRLARSGAQIESMEGFAVLRAAELAGVAAIELRGLSNRAGARERGGWNFEAGSTAVRRLLDALFALFDRDTVRR